MTGGAAAPAGFRSGAGEAARLAPPRTSLGLVARTLVLRSLDLARTGRLTQLIGPAGAGKTVALSQWRDRLLAGSIKVAWYTAHEREREPAAFTRMLAGALHHAGVDLSLTGLPATTDPDPATALDAVLLALERAEADVVVIIDAFERVASPGVNALIQALIETGPERVHVVLSARRKPSLAVSVLRAQGAARTLDIDELRLSRDEIAEVLDLARDSSDLDLIAERTEGWPVAVALFRLWRDRAGGRHGASALFNGQSGEIAEYLAEQVFDTLGPEERGLLFDLAILSEVTPRLADHIRRRSDSGAMLEQIAAALPGLVERAAGAGDRGYRVHPLLADYARGRAELSAAHVAHLRRRAASWLESAQRLPEAVAHARAIGDPGFLVRLLARIDPLRVFLAAGAGELRAILRELSPAQTAAHPRLRLMEALAAFKSGLFLQGRAMLEAVRVQTGGFAADPHGHCRKLGVEAAALELLFGGYLDGASLEEAPLMERIRRGAPDDLLMSAFCDNILIIILAERGDLAGSREALARCHAIYVSQGLTRFAELWLANHHAFLALAHGHLREASEVAAGLRRQRLGELASDVPTLALAQITLAVCAYERRFSEEASEALRQGLKQLGSAETWFEPYAVAYPIMAEVAWRRGGLEGVGHFIAEAGTKARARGMAHVEAHLEALRIAWVVRGGGAKALAESRTAISKAWSAETGVPWRLEDARAAALALCSLAEGDPGRAHLHARRLIAAGGAGRRLGTELKGHILDALAFAAEADSVAARGVMEAALLLAAPEQACAVFAEEGAPVEAFVREIAADEAAPAAPRRQAELVLRALALGRREVSVLNEREARIVGYLADGASNKLIARRMGLTENTIKFHLKRIFAKLGVTHRRDAVAAFSRQSGPAADPPA